MTADEVRRALVEFHERRVAELKAEQEAERWAGAIIRQDMVTRAAVAAWEAGKHALDYSQRNNIKHVTNTAIESLAASCRRLRVELPKATPGYELPVELRKALDVQAPERVG